MNLIFNSNNPEETEEVIDTSIYYYNDKQGLTFYFEVEDKEQANILEEELQSLFDAYNISGTFELENKMKTAEQKLSEMTKAIYRKIANIRESQKKALESKMLREWREMENTINSLLDIASINGKEL
jgi:hypothetical protein